MPEVGRPRRVHERVASHGRLRVRAAVPRLPGARRGATRRAEFATDLTDAGTVRTRLALRRPPQIFRRAAAGKPTHALAIVSEKLRRVVEHWLLLAIGRLALDDLSKQGLPWPRGGGADLVPAQPRDANPRLWRC